MKDPEKSRADSAAQSRESYKSDLEKSREDNAAQSRRNLGGWGPVPAQYFAMYYGA